MGRLKKGILGGFTGKVGKITGYPLNGQDIVRAIGKRVKPFTERELANQKKFATSQHWLSPLTDFLRIGFQDYAPTYQGFVAAKAYNSKHALVSDDSGFYMNPEMILVSYGKQPLPSNASVKSEAPLQVTFSWDTAGKYPYNDRAMLLVYDAENHYTSFETAGPRRNTGTATLTLSKKFEGKKVYAYLAFVAEDRKNRSNSMYLGEIEM